MLDIGIKAFKDDIIALGWVGRYGGVTRLATKEGSNPSDTVYYPISLTTSFTECWKDELYKKLVPDDKVKSILYFEEVDDLIVIPNSKTTTIIGHLNCMMWVNLPLLGLDLNTSKNLFIADLLKVFKPQKSLEGFSVSINVSKIHNLEQTMSLFSKYNYSNIKRLFYYPSLPISLTVNVKLEGSLSCLASQTINAPINCENLAYD